MKEKMWSGRFAKQSDKIADDFNSSISFDSRMYKEDIKGSMAHAAMLGAKGIISQNDADAIISGLENILSDIENGRLEIDMSAEDIHMFVESVLTERIGDAGKKLHTARSRNDQVSLDLRMYLKNQSNEIQSLIDSLLYEIIKIAKSNKDTVMPGYTHLQRAQPITFAHHILAYGSMLSRDKERISDAVKRMNVSPLGSCALAGTTYDIDRNMTAEKLGFEGVALNSIDGVSDRDFCVELISDFSILMMHLSRFSEEIILWSSLEFKFVELDDSFTTGSSIMPQKKNSDMAELVRGKTGRVYGDLMSILTTLKGIPLAYNKDMQEDKEAIFDAVDTVKACLTVFAPMISTMKVNKDVMYKAAMTGFINATDLADYLTKKGMPFRSAYKCVGEVVRKCIEENKTFEDISIEEYEKICVLFTNDVYDAIDLKNCVARRVSSGGTGRESVENQIRFIEGIIIKK